MSTIPIRFRVGGATTRDRVAPARALPAIWREVSATVSVWIARSQQRRALRELAECSDRGHRLGDIGVAPEDARRAAAKWFWQP